MRTSDIWFPNEKAKYLASQNLVYAYGSPLLKLRRTQKNPICFLFLPYFKTQNIEKLEKAVISKNQKSDKEQEKTLLESNGGNEILTTITGPAT